MLYEQTRVRFTNLAYLKEKSSYRLLSIRQWKIITVIRLSLKNLGSTFRNHPRLVAKNCRTYRFLDHMEYHTPAAVLSTLQKSRTTIDLLGLYQSSATFTARVQTHTVSSLPSAAIAHNPLSPQTAETPPAALKVLQFNCNGLIEKATRNLPLHGIEGHHNSSTPQEIKLTYRGNLSTPNHSERNKGGEIHQTSRITLSNKLSESLQEILL